ncbi:THAP domain-containing protein 6 isoform X1 [Oryzias melastigma]|uniref:THAP domain-containing protein 6 isoform X1 n=2 Tax=Oryzias melastigma TaxID=30732 RepID=UPI000CF7C681|nr:THAP domain-containing protein 6 isoform X1 [Oryzias melastigma]
MPSHCCAYNCKNRAGRNKDVTFHKFPSDEKRRREWAKSLRRADEEGQMWIPSKYDVICSAHFKEEDLDRTGQSTRLRDGVKPEVFDFPRRLKRKAPPRRSEGNDEVNPVIPEYSATTDIVTEQQQQAVLTAQDHPYQLPDSRDLRARIDRLNQHRLKLERELRNAKDREKRSRINCLSLLQDLREKSLETEELQSKLEAFTDLLQIPESESSEEQRPCTGDSMT